MIHPEIDFTHGIENNLESDDNYIKHLEDFNNQCRTVLEQLLTGRRINVRDSLIYMGVGHLPRRIKDLRDAGIPVQDEFPMLKNGKKSRYKEYWLKKSFIDEFFESK